MMYRFFDWKLSLAFEAFPQRLSLDIRHYVIEESFRFARVEQRKDVGVIQSRCKLDLTEKTIGAKRRRELRVKHLERNHAVVLDVLREVYCRHSAAAELSVDGVEISKRITELFARKTHRHIACEMALKRGVSRMGFKSES